MRVQRERFTARDHRRLHQESTGTPRTKSFQEEFVLLLKRHNIAYDERYLWH